MFYSSLEEFKQRAGHYIEGIWYPRVTTILEIKAKPGLLKFYANAENFQEASKITSSAAQEGKIVHEMVESIIKGEKVIPPKQYQGFYEAFENFLKENELFVKANWTEGRLRSKIHRYAGTFDILAKLNGKLVILDIKTSKKIYQEYRLQTAAYLEAVNEDPTVFLKKGMGLKLDQPVESRFVLRLSQKMICQKCGGVMILRGIRKTFENVDPDCQHQWSEPIGEWELKEFEFQEKDFKAFLACKALWEWEHEKFLKEIYQI